MWQELLPSSLIKALGGSGGAGGGAENHQSQGGWRGGRLVRVKGDIGFRHTHTHTHTHHKPSSELRLSSNSQSSSPGAGRTKR